MNEDQHRRHSDATAAAVRMAVSLAEARAQEAATAAYCASWRLSSSSVPLDGPMVQGHAAASAAACALELTVAALRATLAAYVAFAADPTERLERDVEHATARRDAHSHAARTAALVDFRACAALTAALAADGRCLACAGYGRIGGCGGCSRYPAGSQWLTDAWARIDAEQAAVPATMTQAQRLAIAAPAHGTRVIDAATEHVYVYNGDEWVAWVGGPRVSD